MNINLSFRVLERNFIDVINTQLSFHTAFYNNFAKTFKCYQPLKAPNKNCSRRQFNFYCYLSKKISLDFFHVNPVPSRGFH